MQTTSPPAAAAAALVLALAAGGASAEVRVVTDIAPVQSLVAMVAGETPEVLIRPGVSPHDAALRPSDARALETAEVVVWIGPDLTPGLEGPIATLAGGARVLTLLPEDEGAEAEDGRDHVDGDHPEGDHVGDDHGESADAQAAGGAALPDGDRSDAVRLGDGVEEEHGADHAEDDHGPAEDAGDHAGEDHAAEAQGDHGHDHAADAHAWLDPARAADWLPLIAEALAEADPDAADDYRARAEAAQARLFAIVETARAELADGGPSYVAAHDALGPFEDRFGLDPLPAIAEGDAAPPSAARMIGLTIAAAARPVDCVLDDGGLNPGLVQAVFPQGAPPVIAVDILGAGMEPGPDLYPTLMRGLLDALDACRQAGR